MNPKDIMRLQSQLGRQAVQRSGKPGSRLLDDGENNVGNSVVLQPQILPPVVAPGVPFTVQKQVSPPRLLNLTAETKFAQSVTVVMTASRTNGSRGGVAGPITGIIEFGNGTQVTRVEFDIPVGPYTGDLLNVAPGTQPEDSGCVIQVPTGIVRAYARYDNAYVTPEIAGYAFGGPGSPAAPLPAGPLPPNNTAGINPNLVPPPVLVKAFASYFGRHYSKLYKTHYIYTNNLTPVTLGVGVAPLNPLAYSIPPFAKSVQVIPIPNTASLTVSLSDLLGVGSLVPLLPLFQETYVIPAGAYPIIPIGGNANTLYISSTTIGAANQVTGVKLVYEIGF